MPNGTFSPATPFTLTSSSALSDDYIMTADVLVDVTSTAPLGVFQNSSGVSEALFVRADGVLCQLAFTPGTGSGGWTVIPVGTTSGITQAVAGLHSDGSVHGFYTDDVNLYHIAYDGTSWSAPDTLPLCSGLGVTNNSITGNLIAYGIDGSGNLQLVRDVTGTWTAGSIPFTSALTGGQVVVLFTDDTDDWVMAAGGGALAGPSLTIYQGSTTQLLSTMAVTTTNPVEQVILGYMVSNAPLFLFTDNQKNLYTNVGSAANVQQVAGASVAQAAGIVDLNNNISLYTVDANSNINVLHQTGWNDTTGPIWAPVIPLDTDFQLLFTGSNQQESPAFFGIDLDGALWSYAVDPVAQMWTSAQAQTTSSESYNVATYRTEVTVVDANGNPVPNLALTVTADSLSAAIVQGAFLPMGPSLPATVTTNAVGRVTLTTVANGTSAPQLTFTADSLTSAAPVNPAANLQSYLGGSGTLNAGTSSQLPQFSATTLATAQVQNQPLAPGAAANSAVASCAAQAISSMYTMNVTGTSSLAVTEGSGTLTGFTLDFTDPNNPTFTPSYSVEDFQKQRALALGGAAGDSWWDEIKDFFVDLWHGIKSAAVSIYKWVVNAVDNTVDFVVKIAGEIQTIVGLVIQGIEDVVAVVQSVFAAIGAEIDKIVSWLKMLFDWSDIADTKAALTSALTQAFPYLATVISQQGSSLVNGFFSTLENDVTNAFDTLIANVTGQSLGDLAGTTSTSSAMFRFGTLATTGPVSQSDLSNLSTVQNNWFFEKVESFFAGGPPLSPVGALTAPLDSMLTAYGTAEQDFLKALTAFGQFFTQTLSDPKSIATTGVADLLTAAKEVCLAVLSFLDGIITSLLEVFAAAVDGVGEILTAPFEIPIISSIVNGIAKLLGITIPAVSIADIFCWAFAIPITIFYKLFNGVSNAPFPGGTLPTSSSTLAAMDDSAAATAMTYCAVGIAALWALFDTGLDAVPDVDIMVFKVIDIIAPALVGIFTWPGGIPFTSVTLDTAEEKSSFANWIVSWAVVLLDVALLVGQSTAAEGSTIARYVDPFGKVSLTAIGAINLVAGIVASSYGASGGAIAANILGPLPVLTQFLRLDSLVESSDGVTYAIKLVVDFFAGEGFAVATAEA